MKLRVEFDLLDIHQDIQKELAGVGVVVSRPDAKIMFLGFLFGAVLPAKNTYVMNRVLRASSAGSCPGSE